MARLELLRHPAAAVLYVRFSEDVTGADFIAALRGTYASPLRRKGDASVWDLSDMRSLVVDLPELQALNEQGNVLAEAGQPGLIVIVAPQDDSFALARLYSVYATRSGRRVEVVRSRQAAWRHLGVAEPDYAALRPLLSPVRRYTAAPRRA